MFSGFMHVYLAIMSVIRVFTKVVELFPGCYKSTQLVAVLLQIMNLCKMLHLYGVATMHSHLELATESKLIKFWILLEILMVLVTLLTPTLYLFLRSLAFREQIIDRLANQRYSDDTKIVDEVEMTVIVTDEEKACMEGTFVRSKKEKPKVKHEDQAEEDVHNLVDNPERTKSVHFKTGTDRRPTRRNDSVDSENRSADESAVECKVKREKFLFKGPGTWQNLK